MFWSNIDLEECLDHRWLDGSYIILSYITFFLSRICIHTALVGHLKLIIWNLHDNDSAFDMQNMTCKNKGNASAMRISHKCDSSEWSKVKRA